MKARDERERAITKTKREKTRRRTKIYIPLDVLK